MATSSLLCMLRYLPTIACSLPEGKSRSSRSGRCLDNAAITVAERITGSRAGDLQV